MKIKLIIFILAMIILSATPVVSQSDSAIHINNHISSYTIITARRLTLTGQVVSQDKIKSVYIALADNNPRNNIFASADNINADSFPLSRLSAQLTVDKFENNKKYNFIIYAAKYNAEPVKIGEFAVAVNIRAPQILLTKSEYTIARNGNAPQPLLGEIRAYYPVSKVNIYIGDSRAPLNQRENSYSKSAGIFNINLNALRAGSPSSDILQNINRPPGIYDGRIEVLSHGGVPKSERSFKIKVIGAQDIIKIARQELMTRGGTKYNRWYGAGEDDSWCAVFMMWCFDQADLLNHVGGKDGGFEYPYNWWLWYKNNGKAHVKTGRYEPKPGDFIFFDWTNNNGKDDEGNYCIERVRHVEIIEKVENGKIYAVGGNTGGGRGTVDQRGWDINNPSIIGYGENNLN